MEPSSLAKFFDEIAQWMFPGHWREVRPSFACARSQMNIVREYSLKLGAETEFSVRMRQNWPRLKSAWSGRSEPRNFQMTLDLVADFLQDYLKLLFKVPTMSQSNLNVNQRVSTFIGFLVQLLHLHHQFPFMNSRLVTDKLRSLITILKDTPFQVTEHPQPMLMSLLAEFETVANEAGFVVHGAFFSPRPALATKAMTLRTPEQLTTDPNSGFQHLGPKRVDDEVNALLRHIDALKPKIDTFLNSFPNNTTITNYVVESDFVVDSLLRDLEDLMKVEKDIGSDVEDVIRKLHLRFKPYRSLTKDIESPKLSEDAALKAVVIQTLNAAYEAEYLIKSFLVGDVPVWYLTIRLSQLIGDAGNIETIPPKKKNLDVAETSSTSQHGNADREFETDDIMFIYENQETEILEQLVYGKRQLQSIFIAGMAGIGKSTFARKLYDCPSVEHHFHVRTWCVVSRTPRWINILTSILFSLRNENNRFPSKQRDEGWLAEQIHKRLKGRKFLIVVDDIWSSEDWEYLRRIFPDDQNGSRIIFTCQHGDVAQPGSIIHELPLWSKEQCWQLLEKMVFHEEPCPPQLIQIGKDIAANCYGLPLVVIVIAGILSTMDKEERSWKNAKGSLDYYVQFDQDTSIMQTLEHSFNSLPQHLKPCFLYFRVFQEDEEVPAKKLKRLWIAEGFIDEEDNEGVEVIAERNLKMLINKNLVIVTKKRSNGGAKLCAIHNLLHGLCSRIAGQENFLATMYDDYSIFNQSHRRMSINVYPTYQPSILAPLGPGLRSLFVTFPDIPLSLHNTKLLRVLECHTTGHDNYSHLAGIMSLLHLRYLGLIHLMPSMSRLCHVINLEYLVVDCEVVLTNRIVKEMVKLRCISSPDIEFGLDCEAHGPNKLEYLSTVHLRKNNDKELLACSPHLRKLKCIIYDSLWGDEEASRCIMYDSLWGDEEASRCFDVRAFNQLESLSMRGDSLHGIHNLQLPSSIKKLNLINLRLHWEKLSTIGALPNLEILKLGVGAFLGRVWVSEDNEFQKLKYLEIARLDFEQWVVDSSEQFPRLRHLILKDCRNLLQIPSEIGEIATLRVIEVGSRYKTSLADSARNIEQEQQDMGNEGLKVIISDRDY